MAVEFREKGQGWQAHVLGEVLLPAPQALLGLRGTGELSGVVFAEIPLELERGETFEHTFDLPALASSWPVRLDFEYDASPRYYIYDGFDIMLPAGGQGSPAAMRIFASEGDGDGPPDTAPPLAVELPTDPPGGSLDATTTVQGTVKFKSPGGSGFICRSCDVHIYDRDTGGE